MFGRRLLNGFIYLLGLAMFLLLSPVGVVYAAPNQGDEVVVDDDLVLHKEDLVNGDLVIISGKLVMQMGSRVEGNVTAFGSQVEIDGLVEGDLVAFGGDVILDSHAWVKGEVVALGGQVHQSEGARAARVIEGIDIAQGEFWRELRIPLFSFDSGPRLWSIFWSLVGLLVGALITSLLGVAIVIFWPSQTTEVGRTIMGAPLPSLGIGCALYPLSMSALLLVLLSLCLAPFAPVLLLLLVAASLFGWVALGTLLGRWLMRRFGWHKATPAAVAGAGVFALNLLVTIVGSIPVLGLVFVLGASSIGLGAVALSRFGTSRYPVRREST